MLKIFTAIKFTVVICGLIFWAKLAMGKSITALDAQRVCQNNLANVASIIENSSSLYKFKKDDSFSKWHKKGLKSAVSLLDNIDSLSDCYYVLRYYTNGFEDSNVYIKNNVPLAQSKYPGFLTILHAGQHVVIYKDPKLIYLNEISLGDQVIAVDDMTADNYFINYILPFYAGSESVTSKISASINLMVADDNPFIPVARTVKFKKYNADVVTLELKYDNLNKDAISYANQYRAPVKKKFMVQKFANGTWIKLPHFQPDIEESVIYTAMLANLRASLSKEYIIFDLRGNVSGVSSWQQAILRNLWGDQYIKSLGSRHDYNHFRETEIRVSKDNVPFLKKQLNHGSIKEYISYLNDKKDFFFQKEIIYYRNSHLYNNKKKYDPTSARAKIIVFTDSFCSNACWDFVKEMKQIPGVIHLGAETDVQTPHILVRNVELPGKYFNLHFPTQRVLSQGDDFGKSQMPDRIYEGDYRNDAEIALWIQNLLRDLK
jgi:hypothetical protein